MSLGADASTIVRRSADYKPSIWTDDHLQSLNTIYGEERFVQKAKKLKEEVIMMLNQKTHPIDQMEFVDVLQRLGISYHFSDYVENVINTVENILIGGGHDWSVHATALGFRLLREQGYNIDPVVFKNVMDDKGSIKSSILNDVKGLLSLYEASYMSMEGEEIMDDIQVLATHHLKQMVKQQNLDAKLADEIKIALEIPIHWRVHRFETRRFVEEVYEKQENMSPLLLEFARLDFNMVQSMYLNELKELSRWHTKTQLTQKMSFARDRLVECFLWTLGFSFEPQFSYCRVLLTKMATLVTVIDDVYDVYGTMDELKTFTDMVERWDINGLDQLPEYMKICYLALFNTVNEAAYDVLRDQGFDIIPYSTKSWLDLLKTYMVEAQWYHSGYKPTLNEFLDNGWVSITGPLIIFQAYLSTTKPLKQTSLVNLQLCPDVVKWPSLVVRLADDLGTSSDELKRGDTPKSIQCYMHDTGCSEAASRAHIKSLIHSTWKKINKDTLLNREHTREFITSSINFARMAQCMYLNGDGHGNPHESKKRILSLVMQPVALPSSFAAY